jgi:chromosome partitioning protein
MVDPNENGEARRGWRLSDEIEESEMPEGFSWSWQHDGRNNAPIDWTGGSAAGNSQADSAESWLAMGEPAQPSLFAEPRLDSVGAAAGEESVSLSFSDAPDRAQRGDPMAGHQDPTADEALLGYDYGSAGAEPEGSPSYGRVPEQAQPASADPLAGASTEAGEVTDIMDTPIAREAQAAVEALSRSNQPLPLPAGTRTFVVANQKGGVGKTTTTVNIAASLAQYGARVLVVDLDPQGNASTALGIDHHADVPSVYDVLIERCTVDEVIIPVTDVPGLFCVPATIDLAGAEIELVSMVARESRLQRALTEYAQDMDYIFIDCPPSLGLLTVNALVAGHEVLIPIQCEYYALEGLGQLLRNIELVRAHLNPALHVSTILMTMYDGRTRLAAQVSDEVRTHFPREVLKTAIPRSVRISEAPSYSQTVMTYDPASSGALAYREAAREIAERFAATEADAGEPTTAEVDRTMDEVGR